jgi:tRNA(adenine34) deaminase
MSEQQAALDAEFMRRALDEARLAGEAGEAPVGAVIVRDGEIIASAHNLKESQPDPTAHAEVLALRSAARLLGSWRLHGCSLYVTLEPCVMCAGAMVHARIDRLVYGAHDLKTGAAGSLWDVLRDERNNHWVDVRGGVLAEECGSLLQEFFSARRDG